MRRYPLDALVEASGLSEAALGRRVGLSGSTLKQARAVGLTEVGADRYAVRAGLHPWTVWPDMEHDAIAAAAEADEQRRERVRQIARDSARKRYWEDPEIRQKRLENARRYRTENRSYVLDEQRRRRQRDLERRRQADRDYYRRNREQILAKLRERRRSEAA